MRGGVLAVRVHPVLLTQNGACTVMPAVAVSTHVGVGPCVRVRDGLEVEQHCRVVSVAAEGPLGFLPTLVMGSWS